MADVEDINEDQWLYGEGGEAGPAIPATETNGDGDAPMDEEPAREAPDAESEPVEDPPQLRDTEKEESELKPPGEDDFLPAPGTEEPAPPGEGSPKEGEEEGEDDDDDDDSDDDIRVTIGDIKTAPPQYSGLSKMRGAVLSSGLDKHIKVGKFSIDEFESIGSINGYPAHEFSIDAMEEKPWRKPGADITDYFNYGFNEDTWRAYCERQKTLRVHESGVGLGGLGMPRNSSLVNVITDSNKYIGGGTGGPPLGAPPMVQPATAGVRKPAPPVGSIAGARRTTGVIDVIGAGVASRRATDSPPPQENVIQVMSSDRRDYSKSFDLSVPPPGFDAPPPGVAPPPVMPGYPPLGGYPGEYYGPDTNMEYYSSSYEPTQDMQRWGGSEVRSSRQRDRHSRGDSMSPPHKRTDRHAHGGSVGKDDLPGGITIKQEPIDKGYKDSRERERERSERHKERSHRHRSRSRSTDRDRRSSRKHKSRSRSPGHRSHKKKKSKKSDKRENSSGD